MKKKKAKTPDCFRCYGCYGLTDDCFGCPYADECEDFTVECEIDEIDETAIEEAEEYGLD